MGNCVKGQLTFEFIITIVFILAIFVVGLAVFEARQNLNVSYSDKWFAQNTAHKLARNINNAALLDDNAQISDSIVFDLKGVLVAVKGNTLSFYKANFFIDAPLATSNVFFGVTDLNGVILFKKINGAVVVSYP